MGVKTGGLDPALKVDASRRRGGRSGPGRMLLIALVFLAQAGCGSADAPRERGRQGAAPPLVEAVPAQVGALPLEERLSGVVKAQNQVDIRAEVTAPILEVLVRNGDTIKRGQPLLRLQEGPLREQVQQAEASVRLEEAAQKEAQARLTELEAQVTRTRSLADGALVSDLELETREAQLAAARANADQAAARLDQARATLEERRSRLEKTLVRAPVSGRIGRRNAEVGMLVDPGTLLFVAGQLNTLTVEVPLTEAMLAYIRAGQPVRISSPGLGDPPLEAPLSRISPFLNRNSFSTTGEIDIPNRDGRLLPGMFVTVDVLYGQSEQATLVPLSALWEDPRTGVRGAFVARLADGEKDPQTKNTEASAEAHPVELRPLEVLAMGRATAGVRGLEPGEWVVTVGQHLLGGKQNQARVRPTTWERVLELQSLQREDLLQKFLSKQQRLARTQGIEPPRIDAFLAGDPPAPPASP